MKKILTILSLFYFHTGFSQTSTTILPIFPGTNNAPEENKNPAIQTNFLIIIQTLPDANEEGTELDFALEKKGTYSFKLDSSVIVPEEYTLILQDKNTGNTFNLQSPELHTFSVNRAMNKTFFIRMKKSEALTVTQKELLGILLF